MKRDDYILTLTSGLLTVDEPAFNTAIHQFGQFYELREPAKPGFVSIAGADAQHTPINYTEWLKGIRSEGIKAIHFYWHYEQAHPSMPAHIAAAFAGIPTLQMQVSTNKQVSTWRLRTLMSPQYEMKADQFIALIDAQQQPAIMWSRVEELVNESNRLNNRAIVAADQLKDYLQYEGREEYNFLVSQIITEVQVECAVLEQPFVIPSALESLLHKSDFGSLYGRASDREPVFLYPTGSITKDELLQLVNAQPFVSDKWQELERSLQEYTPAGIPASGYPAALQSLDEAAIQELSHTLCRAIAVCCEQHNTQPVIPANLLHCIGPNELGGKRARARSRLSGGDQYYLASIQQPWQLYLFTPVANTSVTPSATTQSEIQSHFVSTLKQTAALAKRMQTAYEEAFSLAEWLLSAEVPAGNFDEAHESAIVAAMTQKGFSEQATFVFKDHFSYMRELSLLQWSHEKIAGLCAISMADVFGGMGSWNDLDPGEEGVEYQRLSADLFETMKRYFAAVLSTDQE